MSALAQERPVDLGPCRATFGPNATETAHCGCDVSCARTGRKFEQRRVWDDPFLDACEPVLEKYRNTRERREAMLILRALRLGPTLEVGEAILRGERVPVSRLDPEWAKAYGLA